MLNITVCDAACGSGHFLLAAARRLAAELARLRSEDREPGQKELRLALRDAVRHCIYGVDLNPLAIDLCHLSLWLEIQDNGRPLSFLNHHIKVGNSLVGATPALVAEGIPDGAYEPVSGDNKAISSDVKKRNKQERNNQLRLFGMDQSEWRSHQAVLSQQMLTLARLPEDVAGDVRRLRESYETYRRQQLDPARWRLDIWTAAFFWSLTSPASPPPTTFDLRPGQPNDAGLSQRQHAEVQRLRDTFRFFTGRLSSPRCFNVAASTVSWVIRLGTKSKWMRRSFSIVATRRSHDLRGHVGNGASRNSRLPLLSSGMRSSVSHGESQPSRNLPSSAVVSL